MSKQSEAKELQRYSTTPLYTGLRLITNIMTKRTMINCAKISMINCANCKNYTSFLVHRPEINYKYYDEKNKRCSLGGFAVNKTAICEMWEEK